MRLIYIPSDNFLSVNGVPIIDFKPLDNTPDELHAIQMYSNSDINVEWFNPKTRKVYTNSNGCAGLPDGFGFIESLISKHKNLSNNT